MGADTVADAASWFCLGVGVLMLAWWAVAIRQGALTRPDRAPAEIRLHLAAEVLTAVLLVVGAVQLRLGAGAGPAVVGLGMLLYTVIASPGYFVARGERPPVVMFAVLGMADAVVLLALLGADLRL